MRCSRSTTWVVACFVVALATPAVAARFTPAADVILYSALEAAWGDYDGDGDADLYIGGVERAALLRNNGDGTFTNVTVAMGLDEHATDQWGCAWGDYNNDGRPDLILVRGLAAPALYRNDGAVFTDVAAAAGLPAPPPDDYGQPATFGRGAAWGDYDGDGWLDLFICYQSLKYQSSYAAVLYRNNGDGTFTDVSAAVELGADVHGVQDGLCCTWADYSGDTRLDLMVARQRDRQDDYPQDWPALVCLQREDGTFRKHEMRAIIDSAAVACGDYNNDGLLDTFFGAGGENRPLLLTSRVVVSEALDPTLEDVGLGALAGPMRGVAWADYDNDGWLDLAVGPIAYAGAPLRLFRNAGGVFTETGVAEGFTAARNFGAVSWADYDRDGRMDLVAACESGSSLLYHNAGAAGDGHFLRVRAVTDRDGDATDANTAEDRDALGARVLVNLDNDPTFPSGTTLARVVDGGSSYMGQNEPVAQFGLGSATTAALGVIFPDGSMVVQTDVAADQEVTVADPPQALGSIAGTVTDALSGQPVGRVGITAAGLMGITDGEGKYVLPRVQAGSGYLVRAARVSYYPAEVAGVTVHAGEVTTVDIAITAGAGAIAGTVREAGTLAPIEGVEVGTRGGPYAYTAVTDAAGEYLIEGVLPGFYSQTYAWKHGYDTAEGPGVEVVDQQTTQLDFVLSPWDPTAHPEVIVHALGGGHPNADVRNPDITPDGRYVVFSSAATNLVPGDENGAEDVFLLDRVSGELSLLSRAADGSQANDDCWYPSISADGRYVGYCSLATNLVPGVATGYANGYVHDRDTGALVLATTADDGAVGDAGSWGALSADGRCFAFRSGATNFDLRDASDHIKLFVRDLPAGRTRRVDVGFDGSVADGGLRDGAAITPDGRYIAFCSEATNLVSDDTNGIVDTFVCDLATGQTERVSVAADGSQAIGLGDRSAQPAISGDGRAVLFLSGGNNLVPGIDEHRDLFLRDRAVATTEIVSYDPSGEPYGSDPAKAARPGSISADSRLAVFHYDWGMDHPGYTVVRDRVVQQSTRLSGAAAIATRARISGNGRFIVVAAPELGNDGIYALYLWEPRLLTFGTLRGTVTDVETGDPIPHAGIWVGGDLFTMAQADGTFAIDVAVTPGTTVKALADGYGPVTQTAVVTEGNVTQLDFALLRGFSDVAIDNWARSSILACVAAGIVNGYPDGSYAPGRPVTRDQMAVYISRALAGGDAGVQVPSGVAEPTFTDVDAEHWAYRYVEYCAGAGVVTGYPDGSYRPEEVVNRGQMAVYVARSVATPTGDAGVPDVPPGAEPAFADVPGEDDAWGWCWKYVEYCAANGIVQGYWDNTYRPAQAVTRDQMAVYVVRAFELPM